VVVVGLNIYDGSMLDTLSSLVHLDDLPKIAELEAALSRLKTKKVGGLSGILELWWSCLTWEATCFNASCLEERVMHSRSGGML